MLKRLKIRELEISRISAYLNGTPTSSRLVKMQHADVVANRTRGTVVRFPAVCIDGRCPQEL